MIIPIIIFLIAIIIAFGMLLYRAWEIKTNRIIIKEERKEYLPKLSFKDTEKIVLFLIKHMIQHIVVFSVKSWFLFITKTKIWIQNKLPKLNKFFKKKENNGTDSRKISFVERAIIESKIKIKKVKEKIKQEHEEELKNVEEEMKEQEEKVDKIV